MGLVRKQRRKYETPNHPWQAQRIEEERKIIEEYGLTNKKQIWKNASILRNFRKQAREITKLRGEKKDSNSKILIQKLNRLNLVKTGSKLSDILNLQLRDVLERRLQTVVYKKNLSNSIKQARQFILHKKISVNGKIISSPSYLINEKDKIEYKNGFSPVLTTVVESKTKNTDEVEVKENLSVKSTETPEVAK
ncbi:30S ribosomal protein S4 [Candidatus Woesearchaeota archaeon]|nr:30S ribosomal protein S4 [Candidatus Woesearchaeota archaeon]